MGPDLAMEAYKRVSEIVGKGYTPQRNAPPYAAHFAELAVNTETGVVRVVRYVAAHDAGAGPQRHPRHSPGALTGAKSALHS